MQLIEVPAMKLRPGMFVAELDRPWLETPFALQGFIVRNDEEIVYVSRFVDHVYVDIDYKGSDLFLPCRPEEPDEETAGLEIKADFEQAKSSFESAATTLDRVFNSIDQKDQSELEAVREAVVPLIGGVFKNKHAMAALVRLKESGEYRYNHGIGMAIWSAILGRHLGLAKDDLEKLVTGCAMCDLGMSRLPQELLTQAEDLDHKQLAIVRGHPQIGIELLKEAGVNDPEILAVVEDHHERYDGSGYPRGVSGASIPLLARIAGLVDTYDAMISCRPYATVRSSFEATQELIDGKDRWFQASLVEQFIQAIGLFPVGALVELNTGEVAIVVNQNEARRLKPEVVVVLDENKKEKAVLDSVDLASLTTVGAQAKWIVRELVPGSHGVSSQDYFI